MALQWLVSFCPELFLCSSNHPLNPTVAVGSVPQPATVLLAVGTCCSNLLPPWPEHPLSLSICPFNIAFRPGHVAPHLIDFHPNPHPDLSLHPKHQACSPTTPSSSVCHYYTQSHTHSKCKCHDWPACLLCAHQSVCWCSAKCFFSFPLLAIFLNAFHAQWPGPAVCICHVSWMPLSSYFLIICYSFVVFLDDDALQGIWLWCIELDKWFQNLISSAGSGNQLHSYPLVDRFCHCFFS